MQDLHGRGGRLCVVGLWPHVDLHDLRQAVGRVSSVSSVRRSSGARLQVVVCTITYSTIF